MRRRRPEVTSGEAHAALTHAYAHAAAQSEAERSRAHHDVRVGWFRLWRAAGFELLVAAATCD